MIDKSMTWENTTDISEGVVKVMSDDEKQNYPRDRDTVRWWIRYFVGTNKRLYNLDVEDVLEHVERLIGKVCST